MHNNVSSPLSEAEYSVFSSLFFLGLVGTLVLVPENSQLRFVKFVLDDVSQTITSEDTRCRSCFNGAMKYINLILKMRYANIGFELDYFD